LIGPWRAIRRLQVDRRHLIVLGLPLELDEAVPVATRAPHALLILAAMVALMVSGVIPNVLIVLIACLFLGLFRCIDVASAYRSIHWQILVLIVGMMPFAIALQKTGGVDIAAAGLIALLGDWGIPALLAGLFTVTAVVGLFISNTATAILMAPVALAVANELQASPYPFAMIVALAASAAFMTPVSSPVNTLVVAPGNYRFSDFVRVGVPFTVIVLLVSVALVPMLLPP
jgi:di/tricarboxylate transporter